MQVLSLECFKQKYINLVFLLFFFRSMVVFSEADGAETGSLQLQSEKKKKNLPQNCPYIHQSLVQEDLSELKKINKNLLFPQ